MDHKHALAETVASQFALPAWRRRDRKIQKLLDRRYDDRNRLIVRWGMWIAALGYMSYGVFDYLIFHDIGTYLVVMRLMIGGLFVLLMEFMLRCNASTSILQGIAACSVAAGAISWLLVAKETVHQDALSIFMIFGTLFVISATLFFRFRFWISFLTSSVITAFYIFSIFYALDTALYKKYVLASYFLNLLALSTFLAWRQEAESYNTFLHSLSANFQKKKAIEKGQKLVEIANTDPLTGLMNRRAITEKFEEIAADASDLNMVLGVILIDVDFFKRYNDVLGHHAGDNCLVDLAEVFNETAAEHNAVVGRHGGEEFVAMCNVRDAEHLTQIASDFCAAVEARRLPHPNRDDDMGIVTISAGASITRRENNPELATLIQEADRALYSAKYAGRATFKFFDPNDTDIEDSSAHLSQLLKDAIAKDLVSVAYQPILHLETGEPIGYEALMRLKDYEGSSISPVVFIPIAEKNGSIVELGNWLIDRVCQDIADYNMDAVVSINLSALQLRTPGFSMQIVERLNRFGISPRRLAFEITEGIDISKEACAPRQIQLLKTLGVQIWLDDFGTGFSGLTSLQRFSFDVVKIDRSFLHNCNTEKGLTMFRDIVAMVRNLDVKILAEGVETEEQRELLSEMDIAYIQGYLLGKPKAIDAYESATELDIAI